MEKKDFYSYNKFIKKIYSSSFYSQILSKYDINGRHTKLDLNKQLEFYHLLSFIFNSYVDYFNNWNGNQKDFEKIKVFLNLKCNFCEKDVPDHVLLNRWATFFVMAKKEFCNMFNNYFEIDLTHCQVVMNKIKIHYYSSMGASAIDLSELLMENIKSLRNSEIEFKGIVYKNEENYLNLIDNIIYDHKFYHKNLFVMVYSTAVPIKPVHWCCILIDFNSLIIYFYNSLAIKEQICSSFIEKFLGSTKEKCKLDFTFITNQARQQYHNILCGVFVTDFAMRMLNCDSNREDFFQKTFNITVNNDILIEKNKNKYFYEYSSIKTNACTRFLKFKALFSLLKDSNV